MADNEMITILLATYANESAAVGALAGLEHWTNARKDVKLSAVGSIQKVDGEVRAEIIRKAEKGALVSGAMGLAKSFLGPVALVGDVVAGVARSVFGDGKEEASAALNKLGDLIDAGSVILVTVGTPEEAEAMGDQMRLMCGSIILHAMSQEVLEAASTAVEEARHVAGAAQQAADD